MDRSTTQGTQRSFISLRDTGDTAIIEARGNDTTMRKLAALVSAALVLSLAVPAFAAVDVSGKLATEFKLGQNSSDEWEITGVTGVELETKVSAEGGSPVKAVIQLSPWKAESGEFDDDGNPTGEFGDPHPAGAPVTIGIDKAWLETQGAFWHGGPTVRTRIGDVEIKWDRYVGHLGDQRGVTLEGIGIGPVTADAFYTWEGAERPMGLAARGVVEGVALSGMVVKRGDENNLTVGAGLEVIPGLDVSAQLALDGERRQAYRLEASADDLLEGITVKVGYRAADTAFAPMYGNQGDDEDQYDLLTGFNVAAETVQSGFHIKGEYDDPTGKANISVSRDVELAGLVVSGEYNAKLQREVETEHTLKARTTIDAIPQLRGLVLSGQVKLQGDNTSYEAGAEYEAPNGIKLGAKYGSAEGFTATAGVKVEF